MEGEGLGENEINETDQAAFSRRPAGDRAFVIALISGVAYTTYLLLYPPQYYSLNGVPPEYRVLYLLYLAFLLFPCVLAGLFFNIYGARIALHSLRSETSARVKALAALFLNCALVLLVFAVLLSLVF